MNKTHKITVKLTPKASSNKVQGWSEDENGQRILKCAVTTVPEKGKANKALIELLAKHYGVAKSNISILRGETDRLKTIEIKGIINP